ncbi:pectate lyase [Natranaerovirga hydrolytica]|uniref:Pectate lyase n=1 Tax=Natranaerovirga hydrolytica TaxID=680378 RepID=A0A4R1MQN5_9FIRM|nr:hypothetical protein [Natranaerovirga hydrolytica]TCK92849.1 pectate lyase [Natranaerovirga hydrolytica]
MKKKRSLSILLTFVLVLSMMLANQMNLFASQLIFNDNYSGATSSNLFTTSYKTLPNDASKPMYIRTGGSISAGSNRVTLSGGRMTIGALSSSSTSSSSTPGGVFDLSQDYRIIINVANTSGNSSKNFQVYVDNNTTSQGNSIHGGASKVYEENIGNISSGNIVIEPNVGTSNSFIQVRTESDVNVTINEITIEYLDGSSPDPDPNPDPDPPTDPEDDLFALVGYATMNGGTTGGVGGNVIYVDNGADLYEALRQKRNDSTPLTVYINGTITQGNSSHSKIDVKDVSDVSIIGVGTQGELDGVGITISRANNIIIRNLSIHHVKDGEGTAIEVTNDSHNIWIDHNEFYSQTDVHKDYYDGLVDIKRNAEYITVSWNKFYDHHKGMLVGHTDNASLAPDKITYHHNYFGNIGTRVPLTRYADVHKFNNFYEDIFGSAINARMGARIRVENNYFDNVGSGEVDTHAGYIQGPIGWYYGSSQTGYWHVTGNTFVNCPVSSYTSTTTFNVPYNYSNVLHSAEQAKALVEQYAGVGIIN